MTTLNAIVSAGPFKDILKGLEILNEQAVFEFDSSGMTIKCLDNDCTAVLRIKADSTLFQHYSFESSQSPLKLGIVLDRLKDITKTLTVKDLVALDYDSAEPQQLTISANGICRTARLVKLDLIKQVSKLPSPTDGFKFSGVVATKGLKDFVRTIPDAVQEFKLIAGAKHLYFRAMHGEEPIEWNPQPTDWVVEKDSVVTFTVRKVKDVLHAAKKSEATIMGGDELPLRIEWTQIEGLDFTAVVAPRMTKS